MGSEIKIPVFAKVQVLPTIVGGQLGMQYALVRSRKIPGVQGIPQQIQGYVVQMHGSRRARLLAWIGDGFSVYPFVERDGVLGMGQTALSLFSISATEGVMQACSAAALLAGRIDMGRDVARYSVQPGGYYRFSHVTRDLGPTALAGTYSAPMLASIGWIGLVYLPSLGLNITSNSVGSQVSQPQSVGNTFVSNATTDSTSVDNAPTAGVISSTTTTSDMVVSGSDTSNSQGKTMFVQNAQGVPTLDSKLHILFEIDFPDALDQLIWRGTTMHDDVCGFDKYLARRLVEAGASKVRDIAARISMKMRWITQTDLYWLTFDKNNSTPDDVNTLMQVETAINTVVLATESLVREYGQEALITADEALFNIHAHKAVSGFGSENATLVLGLSKDSPFRTLRNVESVRSGTWDVMSHFTWLCESIRMPARLDYHCDYEASTGTLEVLCFTPHYSWFAASDVVNNVWTQLDDNTRRLHASQYTIRLAALMAYIGFYSGIPVRRVQVNVCESRLQEDNYLLSVTFERIEFLRVLSVQLVSGYLNNDQNVIPSNTEQILNAELLSIRFDEQSNFTYTDRLPALISRKIQHKPLWKDTRELPESLRGLLRADTLSEIDVFHDESEINTTEIMKIVRDNADSEMIAILELQTVIDRIEAILAQEEQENPELANKPLLYSDSMQARFTISCAASIPFTALLPTSSSNAGSDVEKVGKIPLLAGIGSWEESTRYRQVPDALFEAHLWLARLYRKNGDLDRSLQETAWCVALAPSSTRSWIERSLTYTDKNQYAMAADSLINALRVNTAPYECGFLYYRLAYAQWEMKQFKQAMACYVVSENTSSDEDSLHLTRQEMQQLAHDSGIKPMNLDDAVAILRSANIPVSVTDEILDIMAKVAVKNVDADAPQAAESALWVIAQSRNENSLMALTQSLRYGAYITEYEED